MNTEAAGRLTVVGTGPGGIDHITLKAKRAIRDADVVIGYRHYLEMIIPLIEDKEIVEFPTIDLPAGRDRCAVVRDVIPAGTMSAGMFQYELRVRNDDKEVATGLRELAALELNR